jgi:putative endonuclease
LQNETSLIIFTSLKSKNYTLDCRGGGTCLPAGRLVDVKMYFVYAIPSKIKNYIYVGLTNNVQRRVGEHNNGYNEMTKPYKPFKLILVEKYETRVEARFREKYLKSGIGKDFLKSLIS